MNPSVMKTIGREVIRVKLSRIDSSYKSAYYGTIAVGTPPKKFTVVLDTGSGHLILPSAYCRSPACLAHQRYRRSSSITGIDIDQEGTPVTPDMLRDEISVTFGTGEIDGVFVEDEVCLEGWRKVEDEADDGF